MPNLTQQQLVEALRSLRERVGSVILTVEIDTEPKLKKRGNPYAERVVRKRFRMNGSLGPDYEAAVNRRLERAGEEPNFEAQERSWGERSEDAFVTYGDRQYLVLHERSRSEAVYSVDGETVDAEVLKPYFPAQKEREETVKYRNVFLGNVRSVTFGGETYTVEG